MAKQQVAQKYIFKINTTRLRKARWNLKLTLAEARQNEEIISIGSSQMLRWIDELNGLEDTEERVEAIKREIRYLRRQPNSLQNRRAIKRLYADLDSIQFKPDYMCLIIDKDKDLLRACKGFKINDVKYVRLLGTNGGVKCSTIVFVSERLAPILRARIDNGRDTTVKQVPAKFEAYRALTCSGTIPVSMPKGILLVNDCETVFKENITYLTDEASDEPVMTYIEDYDVTLDESDGYGLMLPSLAERWSEELRLGYTAAGVNTRFSWEKGMIFTFDFLDFAENVANKYIVKDAWGNDVDIRNVELILTTSMLKLWKCYESMEAYLEYCAENHYTFGIAKTSPKQLDRWRNLNYQFIQSYDLTDEQIDELIAPTMRDLYDVVAGDWRKALLFLGGGNINGDDAPTMAYVKALSLDERMFGDPYVRHKIHQLIRRRIDDAKIGVIGVHGNYSIVSGDPYSLCQSIFGLEVTGLLKAGEIYNKYWLDAGADKLACFRAPMSTHGNIRGVTVTRSDEIDHWYRYMDTVTIFNSWDSSAQALNGLD